MEGVTRPQIGADVPSFKTKMRRTLDKVVTANDGNQYTYVWLAITWAKKKWHVPETLNRTKAGRDISF